MINAEDLLYQKRAAEELTRWGFAITPEALSKAEYAGRGPASVRIGNRRYYRWGDVTRWALEKMPPDPQEWKTRAEIVQVLAEHGYPYTKNTIVKYDSDGIGILETRRYMRATYYSVLLALEWARQRERAKKNRPACTGR